jgi:hypothetical protein
MKTIKKAIIGVLAVGLVSLAGCSKEYFDINNNPNQVTAATPELVLPSALASTGSYVTTNFFFLNLWMGYWNWSGNYSINLSDKNYQFTNSYNQGIWSTGYAVLKNYDYIDKQAATLQQPLVQAMGKVMKALHYQYLVDTYGDVPYSQALQGTSAILPAYDKGQVVYDSLFMQLDMALALFKKGDGTFNPGPNDILFGGDISKWQKFANTLKLRMLLRQSEKADRASFIQAQLATIKASGYGFLGAGESASVNPGYVNSSGQQNPFYGSFYQVNTQPTGINNQYKANGYAIAFYKNTKDARLGSFYTPVPATTDKFNGTLFGTTDVQVNSLVSSIGPGVLKGVDQSSPVLPSHMSLFMQAEAAQRGWIAGSAKDFYQQAITESFINLGRTAAEAMAYYSQAGVNNVNFDASDNKIEAIIRQKWASENSLNPFESWSDYRRLGLPSDVPISLEPSVTVRQIPVRLFYPQTEYSFNTTNVNAQGTINQFTSKIFWIK